MTKIYRIELMGRDKAIYATQDDVVKLVEATNRGAKLVLIRQSFINPSSVSSITRDYNEHPEDLLEKPDEELQLALGSPSAKQITR